MVAAWSVTWRTLGGAAGLLVALLSAPSHAAGAAATREQGPCPGCLASLPPGSEPSPLLVLLHGDGDGAAGIFNDWRPAAAARGLAVLALACPKQEGCTARSFWRWNGEPSWLVAQTEELAKRRPLDRSRFWLVGWSGGGSYVGYRTQELERTFAALVIHGGGMEPASASCPSAHSAVYFLVGDRNPFHELAVHLRDHYRACQDDVVWDLLRGADHMAERRALATHREKILDFIVSKRLPRAASDG